jgi:hypothetical protein
MKDNQRGRVEEAWRVPNHDFAGVEVCHRHTIDDVAAKGKKR